MRDKDAGADLTVVVPTLNEAANVPVLVERLHRALCGIDWEVVFVDDDSKDGTTDAVRRIARRDRRVRCIRRLRRRGLAGACIEGFLSSSAPVVAVIDADLQHDESLLPAIFRMVEADEADLVVASRYAGQGEAAGGLNPLRHWGSRLATRIAGLATKTRLSDPMSGFFAIRRDIVEALAPRLSEQGFKILFDIVASAKQPLRVREVPYSFRPRLAGESKLDTNVVLDYLGLLVSKLSRGLVSPRLFGFGLVGSAGVVVHLTILRAALLAGLSFAGGQAAAMTTAMVFNYSLNNAFTFRDRRRRGWRFLTGLLWFAALCSVGLAAGVGVGAFLYQDDQRWWAAGLAGAALGAGWNYVTNSAVTWRAG
ncbi:glycosyltransferase [Jiella sp. M17.18]|uniref:glycosyltransferase n=1 Tax=Jiella sp. M17.18 TaxID=3234247 RepID=UPI0034DE3BE8